MASRFVAFTAAIALASALWAGETGSVRDPEGLVRDLASPYVKVREQATEALVAAGPEADTALIAALPSQDREVALRVRDILPRRVGLPPLEVTDRGARFRVLRKGPGWEIVCEKDGRILWDAGLDPRGGPLDTLPVSLTLAQAVSSPPSPPEVVVRANRAVFGWDRKTGEVTCRMWSGVGDDIGPMREPEQSLPLPEKISTRLACSFKTRLLEAVSEREDGLGPWKVRCVPEREPDQALWEIRLPRGLWFSEAEGKTEERLAGTLEKSFVLQHEIVTLRGNRETVLDLKTGDILSQECLAN